ncbi:HXXEE domain-containing protein [Clostridium sp.]|uniref:HXXEE domain-containing protein n=1 Tax=Clostridium sp. TaxID=1506 RepID=UPI003D6D2A4F
MENAVFIGLTFFAAYHTTTQHSLPIFLTICSFLSFNAVITHIRGAIITKKYSPGMITGIIFQIRVAIISYVVVLKNGYLNIRLVIICFLISPLLEVIFSFRPVKKSTHGYIEKLSLPFKKIFLIFFKFKIKFIILFYSHSEY